VADHQISGRGRNGRIWQSPVNENIYLSLVWSFSREIDSGLHGLSLAIGVVLARVLSTYEIKAKVKWPNDVLAANRKIAGILIETRCQPVGDTIAIIGIGLNYKLSDETRAILDQSVSDVVSNCKENLLPDRNHLTGVLIKELVKACENFETHGFSAFIDDWNRFDVCNGHEIEVRAAQSTWTGKAIGLNSQCGLRVMCADGERVVYAGDVSIRMNQCC
jgi:BirA family biotin operon repressor/biotin-[acetyl-CoA-carboxylase] ligase